MARLLRYRILGVDIAAADYETAAALIIRAAREHRPLAVSALAVHGVMTGVLDRCHRRRLQEFDLLLPDGQPVRWALRWLHGASLRERVYGPALMKHVCAAAAEEGLPVFFYGSSPDVLSGMRASLTAQFPRLQIAGMEPSRFRRLTEQERAESLDRIKTSGAQITFVGLGCPRQEVWTFENRLKLSMPVIAVGAAFPFEAGVLPQAPRALQDMGLEWAFRLLHEPTRLWRRYLLLNPLYLSLVAAQYLGVLRLNTATCPVHEERFG